MVADSFNLGKFEQARILIVGDLMLDRYLWGDVERISPEAPVPIFCIRKRSEIAGGAGNVVSNLAGLGCSVTVIGVRGNDAAGERLNLILQNAKIQSHVLIDTDRPTITKTRIVSHGQQLIRLDEEEIRTVNTDLKEEIIELVKANLSQCNVIILSDYGKGLLQTKELAQLIIKLARDNKIPIIIDPKGKDWDRYSGATCVTPNAKELEAVYGDSVSDKEQLIQAMRSVLSRYNLEWLVVTRGPLGMCLTNQNEAPIFIPTLARQVYDVSGAGDTVIATLALSIGSGFSFPDGAKIANLAAGIVVGKVGTQPINLFELKASLQSTGVDALTSNVMQKIASRPAAVIQIDAWKASGQKIVFTNGCFDLLHPGHIHLLHQAKDLGDRLIVGLNSDASVRRIKGPDRPVLSEIDRASLLGSLQCVDMIVLFEEDTPDEVIRVLRPNVLVKGAGYRKEEVAGGEIVTSYGGEIILMPLLEGYSSTSIRKKILQAKSNDSGIA